MSFLVNLFSGKVEDEVLTDKFLVEFEYPHKHRHLKNQKITICRIYLLEFNDKVDPEKFEKKLVVTEHATCMPGDIYNKQTGQVKSLENALQNPWWKETYDVNFGKKDKKVFFDALFEWRETRLVQSMLDFISQHNLAIVEKAEQKA